METEYEYDALGRLAKVTYPGESGLGIISYTYDTAGNISKISNGEGILREYGYVHMGQLDFIRDYSSPKTNDITPAYIEKTYSYDNNGRTTGISARNSSGITVESFTYTYDNNSQILTKKHVNNLLEQAEQINETTTYTYDNFGRLTQSSKKDNLTPDEQPVVTTYGYDNVGNRISMTEAEAQTTYIYNSLNQLMSSAEGSETTTYTYDGRGNQIRNKG